MASIRWGYVFQGPRPTAEDIQSGIAAYSRRFGVFPSIMVVNVGHLVEGLQSPLGVIVEGDRNVNRSILEFAIPEDQGPADDLDYQAGRLAALLSEVQS